MLEELRRGGTNAEIAARLGISVETVRTHVAAMRSKLYVDDRQELATWVPPREPALAGRWWAGLLLPLVGGRRVAAATTNLVRHHAPIVSGAMFAGLGVALVLGIVLFTHGGGDPSPDATPLVRTTTPAPTPSSTPIAASPTATVPATATPRPALTLYPPGTRSGATEADAVLDALEAQGVEGIGALIKTVRIACPRSGDGVCATAVTEPDSALVDAIPVPCGGPGYRPAADIRAALGASFESGTGLYAVTKSATDNTLYVSLLASGLVTPGSTSSAGPGLLALVIEGDRISRVDFACPQGGTVDILPAIDQVDAAALGNPANAWRAAFVIYLALACATESVAGPCPHGGAFADEVGGVVARCEAYGGGAIESRVDYDAGRDAATVLPLDSACRALRGAAAAAPGAPARTATWLTAANEAKLALTSIPAFPPRLRIGANVVVNTHGNDRMIVRERPGLAEAEVTRVNNGAGFVIKSGPFRNDDKFWWEFESGGWAAEENLQFPADGG